MEARFWKRNSMVSWAMFLMKGHKEKIYTKLLFAAILSLVCSKIAERICIRSAMFFVCSLVCQIKKNWRFLFICLYLPFLYKRATNSFVRSLCMLGTLVSIYAWPIWFAPAVGLLNMVSSMLLLKPFQSGAS